VSGGVLAIFVGAGMYVDCASKVESSCDQTGPGSHDGFYLEVCFFLLKLVLVWIAALLVPYSERKGGKLYKPLPCDEAVSPSLSRKGGRIRIWLCFDLLAFAAVVGLGVYSHMFHIKNDTEWISKSHLYWLKAIYGVLSAPWIILKLPMMFVLVLHVKPTAYNRRGETVRLATSDERAKLRGMFGRGSATVTPESA